MQTVGILQRPEVHWSDHMDTSTSTSTAMKISEDAERKKNEDTKLTRAEVVKISMVRKNLNEENNGSFRDHSLETILLTEPKF